MRHGPHQVAQKSTSTGTFDFRTCSSKFCSLRVISVAGGRSEEVGADSDRGGACTPRSAFVLVQPIAAARRKKRLRWMEFRVMVSSDSLILGSTYHEPPNSAMGTGIWPADLYRDVSTPAVARGSRG